MTSLVSAQPVRAEVASTNVKMSESAANKSEAVTAAAATLPATSASLGADPKASAGDGSGGAITEQNISYSAERIIGNGSFGVVFEAKVVETGEVVAIKKVLQDKRFKNRELQIMRQLVKDPHPNIVALRHCFYSQVRMTLLLSVAEWTRSPSNA